MGAGIPYPPRFTGRSRGRPHDQETAGILRNPVRIAALFDRDAAHEATLNNLVQLRG